ncbi:MAG: NAD-binding protein [Deltaproteobacteria bacterium]|nr:NAD-binding protein [Deltaproteobacteria bacterium]
MDDCGRILAHAREGRRAVVIGGGLLGLEAAGALRSLGMEVAVVALDGQAHGKAARRAFRRAPQGGD